VRSCCTCLYFEALSIRADKNDAVRIPHGIAFADNDITVGVGLSGVHG